MTNNFPIVINAQRMTGSLLCMVMAAATVMRNVLLLRQQMLPL